MSDIVKIFEEIRDVSYQIPLNDEEENNCCAGKMMRFKKSLEIAGYRCRYRICSFRWSETGLPVSVLAISHEDLSAHVYLEVFVDGKWINVDPTWDSGLGSVFQIAKWDGKCSTSIAVRPLELYGDEESRRIMEETSHEEDAADRSRNGDFYAVLNEYFAEIRKQ